MYLNRYLLSINVLFAGSEGSVQSWASSLSLDSQSDEATVEFMRHFVSQLFRDSGAIQLDQKAKFGQLCQVKFLNSKLSFRSNFFKDKTNFISNTPSISELTAVAHINLLFATVSLRILLKNHFSEYN